jgi:hypothetical protein
LLPQRVGHPGDQYVASKTSSLPFRPEEQVDTMEPFYPLRGARFIVPIPELAVL